jgi:glycine/D-amino acid oxidase-like deaminating enzyme
MPLPIENASFWLGTSRNRNLHSRLEGNCEADFAIIGAGFTGLWTAHFLKQLEPKLEIIVLEQGVAGFGGSGRNAGIVSATVDHSHALAIVHFGRAEAGRLARLGLQNIDELAAFAADCDFEHTGQLLVALTPAQVDECRRSVATAHDLGIGGHRFLSADDTRAEINSPLYQGASFAPGGGVIDPIKLVDKLTQGVRLFERTKVQSVDDGVVRVEGGTVTARKVVLATNAYSHLLFPQLARRFIPLYDYILVSEPLTEAQRLAIGWRNRQGVTDGRTFFNYYRLTADDRILWGTSEAIYYPPNRVDEACDHSESHYVMLRESFRRHFPQLGDLAFPFAWGGPIASTTRLTPFFGSLNRGHVLYGLGYTGHGIGSTRIAGKILAHMALARSHELRELAMVQRQPFPYPPEPLRRLAVKTVTSALRRVDTGRKPSMLLRLLDTLGIGFSS